MANELLDFVMTLVRDPDAAARYAEDPHRAIADAHLTNVTSVDVDNLIPVVSESLSMAAPAHDAADANVWASGAATAAFDAFGDQVPAVHASVVYQPVISPADGGAHYPHQPAADPQAFDAPIAAPGPELHDDAPIPDPGHVDPVFEHLADHPVDHPIDDHTTDDHHGWDPHF
ncbi:MAG TPA: Rv0340 family IniB-related protein [Mycobacterium sp.]|jgi:hypothetical protein